MPHAHLPAEDEAVEVAGAGAVGAAAADAEDEGAVSDGGTELELKAQGVLRGGWEGGRGVWCGRGVRWVGGGGGGNNMPFIVKSSCVGGTVGGQAEPGLDWPKGWTRVRGGVAGGAGSVRERQGAQG